MKSKSNWWANGNLKVMGLDLSLTSPGIAHVRDGKVDSTLSIKTTSDEPWAVRLKRISEGIRDEAVRFDPDFIFIENYSYNSAFGREIAGEVHGVIIYHLHVAGFDNTFRVVTPLQLKKFVTGNTKAKKKEMVETVNQLYGTSFKQSHNDQADALGIAMSGYELVQRELHGGRHTPTLPKHQDVVLEKAQETLRSDPTWLTMFNF